MSLPSFSTRKRPRARFRVVVAGVVAVAVAVDRSSVRPFRVLLAAFFVCTTFPLFAEPVTEIYPVSFISSFCLFSMYSHRGSASDFVMELFFFAKSHRSSLRFCCRSELSMDYQTSCGQLVIELCLLFV